jgi:hypothetical protein
MSYARLWQTTAAAKARRYSLRCYLTGPISVVHALIDDLD